MPKIEAVPIRCQFCGSSKFKRQDNSNLLQCQYCEGLTAISSDYSVSDSNFEIINGDAKKNDLLRRLRYFIEHSEFDMADKAFEEARYNYPGDYNFEYCKNALVLKKIIYNTRNAGTGLFCQPYECVKTFDSVMELKKLGIETKEFYEEIDRIYKSIPYGTVEAPTNINFSSQWTDVVISKDNKDSQYVSYLEMIQMRAMYELIVKEGSISHSNYNALVSKRTHILPSLIAFSSLLIIVPVLIGIFLKGNTKSALAGLFKVLFALFLFVIFIGAIGGIIYTIAKSVKDKASKTVKLIEAKKDVEETDAIIAKGKEAVNLAESEVY